MSARVLQRCDVAPRAALRVGGITAVNPRRENSFGGREMHQAAQPCRYRRIGALRRRIDGFWRRDFAVEPWRAAALVVALLVGAYLYAAGLASTVYVRLSWVGVLPLLIAVRSAPPIHAGLCGALWGLCYWFCTGALVPTTVPLTAAACLQVTSGTSIFAFLGSLVTRRYGFHPLLLSATWLLLDAIVCLGGQSIDMRASMGDEVSYSHLVARILGAAFLGAALVFFNAVLLCIISVLAQGNSENWRWAHQSWKLPGAHPACTQATMGRIPSCSHPRAPPMPLRTQGDFRVCLKKPGCEALCVQKSVARDSNGLGA